MPDRADVQRALSSIKRAADYEFFFENLSSPAWIKPLDEAGQFEDPPHPSSTGNYVTYPAWPPSRYLRRMAAVAPADVMRVALRVARTDNIRVRADLLDAALDMPANVAAQLVGPAGDWLKTPHALLLPEQAGALVTHLARGGETLAALTLARRLLAIRPAPSDQQHSDDSPRAGVPTPSGFFDDWHYRQILEEIVPPLIDAVGAPVHALLSDLLETAVGVSRTGSAKEETEDFSYIWQPSIAESEQNNDYDIRPYLVRALRDAAVTLLERDVLSLADLVASLANRRWSVFTRIVLYILSEFPDRDGALSRAYLFNPALVENATVFNEFVIFARAALPLVSSAERDRFFRLLEERLDTERQGADSPNADDTTRAQHAARHHLFRWLTLLQDSLSDTARGSLEQLRTEFPPVQHPEFLHYSERVWHGPTSPLPEAELAKMPVADILGFIRNWEHPGGLADHSPEGLGRALASVVANSPDTFAKAASKFVDVAPTYVRHFLAGLTDARKARRAFPWESVVTLCHSVVAQTPEIEGTEVAYRDVDPGWNWTRKAIANLLSVGFDAEEGGIPHTLRDDVWKVLVALTEDSDPTPEYEAKYGGTNMDPLTISINTTRGEAMHATLRYALWIRRDLETRADNAALARGLAAVPDVQSVLERHLRLEIDPSTAIRAVYGQWLPWLVLLDTAWTKAHLPALLPRDASLVRYRTAAWDAYITYNRAYDNVFDVLEAEYAAAIDRTSSQDAGDERHRSDSHLAEHLMVFYWRGKIGFQNADDLISHFYSKAPARLKAHALAYVGRALRGDEKAPVPMVVQRRLQALLDWRMNQCSSAPLLERRLELGEFGWWFVAGTFPLDWSLTRLLEVLRSTRHIAAKHQVLETLGIFAPEDPRRTAEALRWIVEDDEEPWAVSLRSDSVEIILKAALESDDANARGLATHTINLLGAKGNRAYLGLLENCPRDAAI